MVDHRDISDGVPQESISVKLTCLNPYNRLGMGSRGSMADKPESILCDHFMPEKLLALVINFTVTDVFPGAFVQHLTGGLIAVALIDLAIEALELSKNL